MEKQLFYQLQYAIFATLYANKAISFHEFSGLKEKLHEKTGEFCKNGR